MKFLSVCSGIEAASVAWLPLGWSCLGLAEIDSFCCALLNHYYPAVPNLEDLNEYEHWPALGAIDVLVGGTPCQDFSVAGQRAGLGGARGGLTMRFLDCVERFAPDWVVWENVPGVLSIDGRRAFGAFLGGLGKRGYGFAYRVLDAQYSGLAQRRERVFVVGCSGGRWQRAAAVLFDAPRLRWNPPPRRETGQGTTHRLAPCVGSSGRGFERTGETRGQDCVIPIQEIGKRCSGTPENGVVHGQPGDPMFTIQATAQHGICVAHSLTAEGHDASEDGTPRPVPLVPAVAWACQDGFTPHSVSPPVSATDGGNAGVPVAFTERTRADGRNLETQANLAYAVTNPGSGGRTHSRQLYDGNYGVRRLTPREVERLFGFPDNYTLIPYRGKLACDGPRYRALGNSMAVPLLAWLGRRIELVESLK